jgi:hypothetical protein
MSDPFPLASGVIHPQRGRVAQGLTRVRRVTHLQKMVTKRYESSSAVTAQPPGPSPTTL